MKEGYSYLVIGNKSGGVRHHCEYLEIVKGTGEQSTFAVSALYIREDNKKQWIHSKDVIEIGKF